MLRRCGREAADLEGKSQPIARAEALVKLTEKGHNRRGQQEFGRLFTGNQCSCARLDDQKQWWWPCASKEHAHHIMPPKPQMSRIRTDASPGSALWKQYDGSSAYSKHEETQALGCKRHLAGVACANPVSCICMHCARSHAIKIGRHRHVQVGVSGRRVLFLGTANTVEHLMSFL